MTGVSVPSAAIAGDRPFAIRFNTVVKYFALLTEPLAYHTAILLAIVVVFAACCRASNRWAVVAMQAAAAAAFGLVVDARLRDLPLIFTAIPLLLIAIDMVFYLSPVGTPRRRLVAAGIVAFLLAVELTREPLGQLESFGYSDVETDLDRRVNQFEQMASSPVRTDRGRTVAIREFRGNSAGLDAEIRRLQEALLEKNGLSRRVIAQPTIWETCNCHGHIFAAGKYWVPTEEVAAILEDNGYEKTPTPAIGDLAIYRDSSGAAAHSGVVVGGADGDWLVESKWGKLGCFIHPSSVYMTRGLTCEFFHSNRTGHRLQDADTTVSP